MPPLHRIGISVDGDVVYSRAFEALAEEVEDLSEPLAMAGEVLRQGVSEQFRTEGGHGFGGKWQLLSPEYEAWKQQRVGDEPILVFSGQMRHAALSPDAVTVTPRRMVYEIDDPKAIYHQRGSGNLPKRRLVDPSKDDKRDIDRAFASWLNEVRRGPLSRF